MISFNYNKSLFSSNSMFFSNKKNIFKNNINNSIFTKERKVKSEDNLLFIKIPNRFDLSIKPVRDNKSQLY